MVAFLTDGAQRPIRAELTLCCASIIVDCATFSTWTCREFSCARDARRAARLLAEGLGAEETVAHREHPITARGFIVRADAGTVAAHLRLLHDELVAVADAFERALGGANAVYLALTA